MKGKDAMNILLITTTFPTPARPRQGTFNRLLVEAFGLRHNVQVIAPIPWTQSLRPGTTRTSPFRTLHPVYFYPPKILREHYHRFYWRSIRSAFEAIKRECRPDAIMSYWLHPDGAAALRAAACCQVPVVVMSGGTDLRLLTRDVRRRQAITAVLQGADRLIVFSRELAARAHRLGVPEEKIDVIYRGVNRTCFRNIDRAEARQACCLPRDAVVLMWAGRFEAVKNPVLLLRAAVHWKQRYGTRLRIVMAGDGPQRMALRRLCKQLGLQHHVRFAGNLSQGELALYFNAADATVLTSVSEGVPNVLLESIACGTPFVATEVGGVSEIASPGVDRLVPADDLDALVDAVIGHLGNTGSRIRSFEPTDLAGMARQLDQTLARLTGATAVPAPMMPINNIGAPAPAAPQQLI